MICSNDLCTGCYGCVNICPKQAISMKEDEFGYIYPIINDNKCINCGLCKKVCPSLNQKNIKYSLPKKVYAMYSKDIDIRKKSTSGGIATVIAKYIIKNNGIAYGAGNLFEKNSFDFFRIDSIDDLYKIQGSKYVHCYVKDKYGKVKQDLNDNKRVVFIGTPCQIAGLKMFLQKEYDNLITIDIICHGVPSQKLLFDDLELNMNIKPNDFEYITFRDSKGYNMKIYKSIDDYNANKPLIIKPANLNQYYKNFLRGNIFRDNCYNCTYAKKERISDITIGDFWGLSQTSVINDGIYKGISSVIVSTNKGQSLIDEVLNLFFYEERKYEEVYLHNEQLNKPMEKKKQYYIFKKYYLLEGYNKTFNRMNLFKDYLKYNPVVYSLFRKNK